MSSVITHPGTKVSGDYIEQVMISVKAKNPAEPEFHQAVKEVFDSLRLVLAQASRISVRPASRKNCRARARHHVPRSLVRRSGQYSNQPRFPHRDEQRHRPLQGRTALPSVGEPRHPEFLAFEQVFKNSLTTLPMGGGKGGSDFDPKGRATTKSCASARAL